VGYVAALGGSLTLEARGEFIAERIEVFADGAATLPYGTAYRWLLGGRAGAGFAWAFADPVAVVLGGTVSVRGPATDVFIGNDVRATIPVVAYGAEAGLRFTVR
jgi:hypothetical protein